MDNQIIGALIGIGLAGINYVLIGQIIRNREAAVGNNRDPNLRRTVSILNAVRVSELLWMPALTYFLFGFIDEPIIK